MTDALHHLTIDTGHLLATSRADVAEHVIAALQPLIDAEQGAVPATRLWLDLIRPLGPDRRPRDGAAAFSLQVGRGGRVAATNVVCWRAEIADEAWRLVQAPERAPLTGRVIRRPPVPWLATTLHPGVAELDEGEIMALADVERCLAWTLIETPL